MTKHIADAYIVAATRSPVGKAPRGALRHMRPDDLLAQVLRAAVAQCPGLVLSDIDDVVVGCAMPEGEQGMNVARMGALLAGFPHSVSGVTINRFCASGLQAVADAAARIRLGEAEVMIAAGTESMSMVPMGGNKPSFSPEIFTHDQHLAMAYGMGITSECVAERWQVSREDQDVYAAESHRRAIAARDSGVFDAEISPCMVTQRIPDLQARDIRVQTQQFKNDEGPRSDTSLAVLSKLRPAFSQTGSVTAGNSSQMSDGAGAVVLMSESAMKRYGLQPLGRFLGFAVAGVAPEVMGIGPVEAIPKVLKQVGLTQQALEWIELNEAFAAQTLAVIRQLDLDPNIVNPVGGAIALGHPLGATGAIRVATLLHGMRQRQLKYGMVTMCIGTGMGAAGVFERL